MSYNAKLIALIAFIALSVIVLLSLLPLEEAGISPDMRLVFSVVSGLFIGNMSFKAYVVFKRGF